MTPASKPQAPDDAPSGQRRIPKRQLLWLSAGLGLWFSAVVWVYVLHELGCSFRWSPAALRLSFAAVILVHLGLIGALWWQQTRRGPNPAFGKAGEFLHWVIVGTLIAGLAKIIFTLGPTLFLSVCT